MIDSILIVIVIYELKLDESLSFSSLTKAFSGEHLPASLFIYDNSLEAQRVPTNSKWNIIYTHDKSNPGVSKGYNQGFITAKTLGKKWMLLADQDTHFPMDFFKCLKNAIASNPGNELFVPIVRNESLQISPFKFRFGIGFVSQAIPTQRNSLIDLKFINTGLLVSTELFERCGGYDERFSLDFSDMAFLQRVEKHARTFILINATCIQNLSSDGSSLIKSLERFRHYLKASVLFGKTYEHEFTLFVNRLYRALKLSYKFKSIEFIKLLFRNK